MDDLDHIAPHLRVPIAMSGPNGTSATVELAALVAVGILPDPDPAASEAWEATRHPRRAKAPRARLTRPVTIPTSGPIVTLAEGSTVRVISRGPDLVRIEHNGLRTLVDPGAIEPS